MGFLKELHIYPFWIHESPCSTHVMSQISLCHQCIHATVLLLPYMVINIMIKWSILIQSCSITSSEINVLHECTLPPIGKLLAPHLMHTAAHYFRFIVHLCSTHKWDFPKQDLRILEWAHGCFRHHELQFHSNINTFIKSCPSTIYTLNVVLFSTYLQCEELQNRV